MKDFIFGIMMFLLTIIILSGILFFLATKIATMLSIIILLSPFAIAIMWKIKQVKKKYC